MTEQTRQRIEAAEQTLLHTYNRFPVILDRGEGMYLYDTEGKRYLDFFSGIGVFALGHHYPGFDEALKAQIDKLLHTSNYFYNEPAMAAAKKLTEVSGLSRVFFTNSGAEAVEGAVKCARRYARNGGREDAFEIIAMEHSFHGRTMGALSVTGTESYRAPFEPLIGGVRFAKLNDMDSVREQLSEKTCAVILEVIQGEGGVICAEEDFLRELRALCDEKDIVLIFDEIQCGMGRTGELFAWETAGVRPDVMTLAKGLGCGVPVGAFLVREEVAAEGLRPGDHGTTYGGNPFACAAVARVLDLFERDHIIEHVREVAPYLTERLEDIRASHPGITERRGRGLMQGLVFERPVADVLQRAREKGLILINAGANVLRFLPPLVVTRQEIDEMAALLKESL
ncbi:MAG: aspartate aminotransferase family protein [Lachnospiraceae bacterium]|nr:aspartate aminotransferase family protein [Lachnospiraceae bacterium]